MRSRMGSASACADVEILLLLQTLIYSVLVVIEILVIVPIGTVLVRHHRRVDHLLSTACIYFIQKNGLLSDILYATGALAAGTRPLHSC